MIETVNGYVCHNCSDVALAKRDIDPAHPKDGPDGSNATQKTDATSRNTAVVFGGNLLTGAAPGVTPAGAATDPQQQARAATTSQGAKLDLTV